MGAPTVLLAGGGTGGHVYPMVAVADQLQRLRGDLNIVFVGTDRGIESQVVPERGYPLELVATEPIRGRGLVGALKGVRRAAASVPEALALVDRLEPLVVFSMGGYAAGTVSVAARIRRIPLALMEPNSVIGLTNRLSAPLVQRAYTAYPAVERHFPKGAVRRTGLAIRSGFAAQDYAYTQGRLRVLVLGGSQGAAALNRVLPEALSQAKISVNVLHQAGKGKDEAVRAAYNALGGGEETRVVPFLDDMPRALRDADLVVGRSGAGAVSEICAVGRPSLLIPYPHASGDHQLHNARALVEAGAAVCVPAQEATTTRIRRELDALVTQPGRLVSMAGAARALGAPDAAVRVAVDLARLGGIECGDSSLDDLAAGEEGSEERSSPPLVH